jgi:hypothetical protein
MADRDTTPMSKVLSNVEQELQGLPTPARTPSPNVESFAPQKYRERGDTMEQIQQDFRKAVAEMEQRFKALTDELKRITG